MTDQEKKAIIELQELYDYDYYKGRYESCKTMISVFCILNKHLTGRTGWEIRFEGSKADDLINVYEEQA